MFRCHAPAKINLCLFVTGRRADGFHELASVVARTALGDTLSLNLVDGAEDVLSCSDGALGVGPDNLVLRATALWREAHPQGLPEGRGCRWRLEKRIPVGAGLGGGSSDAAAALRLLNQASVSPWTGEALQSLGAQLGSDVPLFLEAAPLVELAGRGERVTPLPDAGLGALGAAGLVLARPPFAVATAWAYGRLAEQASYAAPQTALEVIDAWRASAAEGFRTPLPGVEAATHNSFRGVIDRKYPTIPVVLDALRALPEVITAQLSGSGSACFVLHTGHPAAILELLRNAWGAGAWVHGTQFCKNPLDMPADGP